MTQSVDSQVSAVERLAKADPPGFDVKDAAGVTPKQRLEYLVNSHDQVLMAYADSQTTPARAAELERLFVYRCVGTLLYSKGRVAFPSELSKEEAKRYSTNRNSPYYDENRIVFSADGAWYEYFKGDLADVDLALDCLAARNGSEDRTQCLQTELVYEQALATFGIHPKEGRVK